VDFGIARRLDSNTAAALTQTGLVIGTPHYMSPEQALGDPNLDQRSDLYSLGAVLFQMVTGAPPFDGESSQQVVGKHIADPPPAAHVVNPQVPREFSEVILRLLAKQPRERFQSAAEVIAALESDKQPSTMRSRAQAAAAATELLVSGERTRPSARAQRKAAGRSGMWIAAGVVLLVLAGAAAFWFTQPRLTFTNQMIDTVAVQIGGVTRQVPPGGSFSESLSRGQPLTLNWRLIRLRTAAGVVGVSVGDTINVMKPGRLKLAATASPRHGAYFAPLITNETGRPISILVNAGLAGALPCDCWVPAGAVRMPIGYYPLFQNSSVRAADREGHAAMFRDLGPQVDATKGTVGLLFRAGDLR
jgi:hypothetical protein